MQLLFNFILLKFQLGYMKKKKKKRAALNSFPISTFRNQNHLVRDVTVVHPRYFPIYEKASNS